MFVQRCALLARVCEALKTVPDENGKEKPAVIERCERMHRGIMLQRLLSLGPSNFPLAAEAMDLLGIDQTEAEVCVANCFTVSLLHYAINIDAPTAPRSPAKAGRISFARVDLNTSSGGGSVEKHDILAPSLSLRPDTSAASLLAQWEIGSSCPPFAMNAPLSAQAMHQVSLCLTPFTVYYLVVTPLSGGSPRQKTCKSRQHHSAASRAFYSQHFFGAPGGCRADHARMHLLSVICRQQRCNSSQELICAQTHRYLHQPQVF